MKIKKNNKTSIAITGTSGLIGRHLLTALIEDKTIAKIVAIDKAKPRLSDKKIVFVKADMLDPKSVDIIGKTLIKHRCKTLLHCALPNNPSKHKILLHELQVTGSMHILLACESANISKLILASTTEVFGAVPDNPSFLTEEHPLKGSVHGSFLRDKIDVEKQFLRFQRRFPKKCVTIFRPCTIIGHNIQNPMGGFLYEPTVFTILGFDPLLQFIHLKDVIRAFKTALKRNFKGIFNLVGDGVLPLSRALKIMGKVNVPIASLLIYPAQSILWHLNIGSAPAKQLDLLKYQFIADGTKAKKLMKFEPVYSSQEALLSVAKKV